MARVKGAMMTRKRRNKTLKLAKGYFGAKPRCELITRGVKRKRYCYPIKHRFSVRHNIFKRISLL